MTNVKPARNEPCPCGSGKKHKKCCGLEAPSVARRAWRPVGPAAPDSIAKSMAPTHDEMTQLVALFNDGRFTELETVARQLVEQFPDAGFVWKVLAVVLQVQGKGALTAFRTTTKLLPGDAEAHNNLAAALNDIGQLDEALTSCRKALEINPAYAEAHYNLSNILRDLGKLEDAVASCHRAIEIKPDYAEAHNNLGVILQRLGRFDAAMASCRSALATNSDFVAAHCNLGNAMQALGQYHDATTSYRRALEIKPDFAQAHSNLGNLLRVIGQFDDAVESCFRALEISPDYADAHNNIGMVLQDIGKLDDAAASYRRAVSINANFAEAHNNLGNILQLFGQLDDAAKSYGRAIAIKPDFAEAHSNLGSVYRLQGNLQKAKASYQKSQILGFDGAWVLDALMLPAIMGTREEVLESRAQFEHDLVQLTAKAQPLNDPLKDSAGANFYLAYHGLNDRDLQVKLARYYERVCPSLQYSATHCMTPKSDTHEKIRIGFFSKFLYNHSISICFSKIIELLSLRSQFEVFLISDQTADATIYSNVVGTQVRVPRNLVQAREIMASLKLDILTYLDIGMEPLSYFLAFARLARVQCVLAGHPVTTGIANIDYFLSNDLMEPSDCADHYSETLIRLPNNVSYFSRPVLPSALKTRGEFGLKDEALLYMCPMRLQKMHPDFDEAIARILQLDREGVIVLFDDIQLPFGKAILLERFKRTIQADVLERIIFLPWLSDPTDLLSAIACADVILDPFHFGIGSTAMMVFATGTPLVTKPSNYMRGRVGMGFCKMMKVPECVADDSEDYSQKAVQIARNSTLRAKIVEKIKKNSPILYENSLCVDDLAAFFCSVDILRTNK